MDHAVLIESSVEADNDEAKGDLKRNSGTESTV